MITDSENLYANYTNRSPSQQGAMARSKQRLRWLRQYNKNGTCKRKLEQARIL